MRLAMQTCRIRNQRECGSPGCYRTAAVQSAWLGGHNHAVLSGQFDQAKRIDTGAMLLIRRQNSGWYERCSDLR